jgi:hypothetical protein
MRSARRVRTDDKISVPALSKPGFELQWNVKLDNQPRGVHGPGQGVTASGVTIFIPMSIVTAARTRSTESTTISATSSGNGSHDHAAINGISPMPWRQRSGKPMGRCSRSTTDRQNGFAGAAQWAIAACSASPGKACRSKRVPEDDLVILRQSRTQRPVPAAVVPVRNPPLPPPPAPGAPPADQFPDRRAAKAAFIPVPPSGVYYVITSDGLLHVLGLPSGKDMQRPAPFLPANARWSSPIAIDTMLYAATFAGCGGAPHAVWAIDLDSDTKPVVSWKTNGGPIVGAVAFASDGTLFAAIGAGQTTGDGKANAIVALDPKTLRMKDWFTQPTAEFVSGPTILRHNGREIIAAATRDGRVLLLDAKSSNATSVAWMR